LTNDEEMMRKNASNEVGTLPLSPLDKMSSKFAAMTVIQIDASVPSGVPRVSRI
jgi:hypothetical protein